MDVRNVLEELNVIALDASFIDVMSDEALGVLFESLIQFGESLDGFMVRDEWHELVMCTKHHVLSLSAHDNALRQKVLSFCIDYFQQMVSSLCVGDPRVCSKALLETELHRLICGGDGCGERSGGVHPELIGEFVTTLGSSLEDIERDILYVEKNGFDGERINGVFRAFHTMKSEAHLLGLSTVGNLLHKGEDLLEKLRTETIPLRGDSITILFECVDNLRRIMPMLVDGQEQGLDEVISQVMTDIDRVLQGGCAGGDASMPAGTESMSQSDVAEVEVFVPQVPVLDLSEGTELFEEFLVESREHLTTSEDAILALENNPQDMDAINRVFRAFHTIKGVASFLNLQDIKQLAHTSETMLDLVRKGTLVFDTRITDATLTSIDQLGILINCVEEQVFNNGSLLREYINIGVQLRRLDAIIQGECVVRGTERIGEIMINEGIITPDELHNALKLQETTGQGKKIGEILTDMHAASAKDVQSAVSIQNGKMDNSIKISLGKLDTLVNLVGEIVITETQVTHNPLLRNIEDVRLSKDLSELERITRLLQENAMSMRLVPVRAMFQKMLRIIRDLSKKIHKDVVVRLSGEDTEIDKNMVELVSDPLVHMVRNAVDHGIESPDERIAAGKPASGVIELSAFHKGGNVVIQIKDDGKGLNKEKILAKARERGIVGQDEHLPDKRIWNLVFEPGFSTADVVTDVSGRGVGMDVVRKNIERLRGRIDITSEQDTGSCFSIHLPITLAIIEGIVLRVGRERYVVPINSVVEFVLPDVRNVTNVVGHGDVYAFQGNMYPLIYMDTLFNASCHSVLSEDKTLCIVDSEYGQYCLLVDEVLGQQQVVIKGLSGRLKHLQGVTGAAILGDGRVGLILDVNGVVECFRTVGSVCVADV